jgi:CMP-N,N'-diacetyllegionaminic acid synthase
MSAIWAIVPARAGSKGIPNKNVRELGGHPLLAWSVRAGVKTPNIERVIISTDSAAYAEIGTSYGAEAPFLRPTELATDAATDITFMQHAIAWFLAKEGRVADYFVHLRPTTPLRDVVVLERAVEVLLASNTATALRSVHEMSETAYKCFERNEAGILQRIAGGGSVVDPANDVRQSFPKTYFANGYVDVVRTSLICEKGLLHGNSVQGFVTPTVTEVNTNEDLEYITFQLQRRPEIARALFL